MEQAKDVVVQRVTPEVLPPLRSACYPHLKRGEFNGFARQMLDWQAHGRVVWLFAACDGAIVGNGQLLIYPGGTEIANLVVVATWRGRGIGTQLIRLLEQEAIALDVTAVEMGVALDNGRAARLYARLGYRLDRTLTPPDGRPIAILRKPLTAPTPDAA